LGADLRLGLILKAGFKLGLILKAGFKAGAHLAGFKAGAHLKDRSLSWRQTRLQGWGTD
jgi:hypothetical protein